MNINYNLILPQILCACILHTPCSATLPTKCTVMQCCSVLRQVQLLLLHYLGHGLCRSQISCSSFCIVINFNPIVNYYPFYSSLFFLQNACQNIRISESFEPCKNWRGDQKEKFICKWQKSEVLGFLFFTCICKFPIS